MAKRKAKAPAKSSKHISPTGDDMRVKKVMLALTLDEWEELDHAATVEGRALAVYCRRAVIAWTNLNRADLSPSD
jgi:hypothetical protein